MMRGTAYFAEFKKNLQILKGIVPFIADEELEQPDALKALEFAATRLNLTKDSL